MQNIWKRNSQGDPESIKNICKSDTLPEDYEKIILKNREEGNEVLSLCGKKVKMSYLQCQRIERKKCESNMIFLGFVFYRSAKVEQNPGYSWQKIHLENFINIINIRLLYYIHKRKKTIINKFNNYFLYILIILNFNYIYKLKIFN